jgi:hypothetical protein
MISRYKRIYSPKLKRHPNFSKVIYARKRSNAVLIVLGFLPVVIKERAFIVFTRSNVSIRTSWKEVRDKNHERLIGFASTVAV